MRDPLDNPMAGCGGGGCLLSLLIGVVLMMLLWLTQW